jgi:peptidoglycan/LPS O-acetylase OafA/YrhL
MGRSVALDLLRGLAAASVAIPHFLVYGGGPAALETLSIVSVEVFFVLSGFVLAPQILLVLERRRARDFGIFLARRWMRTVPAYAVAVLFTSALFGAIGGADFWRYLGYVQNFAAQHNTRDYYAIAWSLSVEEWFYLAFPAFLLAASLGRTPSTRTYAVAAGAFIAIVTVLRIAFGNPDTWDASVRRVVLFRVDAIAWGFLLFMALNSRSIRTPTALLTLVGSAMALGILLLEIDGGRVAQALYHFAAAAFGSACIALALALESKVQRMRPISEVTGATSYAVYLFHMLAIYLTARMGLAGVSGLVAFCALTAALALASSYGLERPILASRPNYPTPRVRPESGNHRTAIS